VGVTWGVRSPVSAVVRIVVLVVLVGLLAGFSLPGVFTEWRLGRRLPDGETPDRQAHDGQDHDGTAGRRRRLGRTHRDPDTRGAEATGHRAEPPGDFDRLFSSEERRELEAAFTEAHSEELEQLRARASEAAARLRSSAVPVHEVCSIGAGHRAETLRVRFADGTTVVLCCRGSSGSYWVQALRRQILLGSVVLDRMTFGLAGPVVVFGTPAGEVFVMADLVTIGS
jgi:hypothetical protein